MEITLFQIVNYSLILIFLILFARYIWIVYFSRDREPVQWTHARKGGNLPDGIRKLKRKYPDKVRFFNWWFQVERLKKENVPGVFIELGVYQGESAKVIHFMDPDRKLYLFDTFSGFTAKDLQVETGEAATYTPDNFKDTSIRQVLENIGGNSNILIREGYFPDSAGNFNEQVAMVNMDADLYNPTKAGLEFFYPLLSPGGVILIHDYNIRWPGIIKAVDDFVKTIPETLVPLPDIHGTVMIIRNK